METIDLNRVRPGHHVEGVFALVRKDPKLTKKQQPYFTLEIRNESGSIGGNAWTEFKDIVHSIPLGAAVHIEGQVKEGWNNGPPEIEFKVINLVPGKHPVLESLNPRCPVPLESLVERFESLVGRIRHPGYRLFVERFFGTVCPRDKFFTAPGAMVHHHNYLHGLLEHTCEVVELAIAAINLPAVAGKVNADAVIAGALIHDSGKVDEYEWEGVPMRVSNIGKGAHHIPLGIAHTQVLRYIAGRELRNAGFSDADFDHMVHIQQSHHGMPEWGSYIEPRSIEAIVVHNADQLSAKPRTAISALDRGVPDGSGWVGGMKGFFWGLYAPQVGAQTASEGPATAVTPVAPQYELSPNEPEGHDLLLADMWTQ